MCSLQDLIEKAKTEIEEDVEFFPAPPNIETEMQRKGVMAGYDFNHDIIYYSKTLISSRDQDYQIQTFMHELAHAKDLRECVANGLLKIILPKEEILETHWKKIVEYFHEATEFQISNFLYSKFNFTLPHNPQTDRYLADDLFFSLIPAIEYLYFGEEKRLREEFKLKLDEKLDEKWLFIYSLLKGLNFADSHSFETEFVKLSRCLGFIIQIKTESNTEELKNNFKILQTNKIEDIKIFELINFDFRRSIFVK